jgi:alkylation response protein AidB-like acyl-CoA dehydrogenase
MSVMQCEETATRIGQTILTGEQILANIRALRPMLGERSDEIDELRCLPDDIVEELRRAGVFRMMMPRIWGGPEMNPMQVNEALEELALGNASAAWCAMIQIDGGLYSGWMDDRVARQMYTRLDMPTSTVLRPLGRARKVDGGYVVNGRWPFASGCRHADWFAGGCFVFEQDGSTQAANASGAPLFKMIIARREEFTIHDTWHTTGLRGTGSNDIEAVDLHVPFERTFDFESVPRDGTLYGWPAMLCAKIPGVALGIARHAIETVSTAMREKKEKSEAVALAVADAHTLHASARAYLYESLNALWRRLSTGQRPDERERAAVFLSRAHAFQASRQAVQLMFDAYGAGAIYGRTSTLDRSLRDINTACQHFMAQRKAQQAAGAWMLGVAEPPGFL